MEYLEMRGAVKLKADADNAVVRSVLSKLRETEFVDAGYIDIGIEENTLSRLPVLQYYEGFPPYT